MVINVKRNLHAFISMEHFKLGRLRRKVSLQTYLPVCPLSLCVDGAVALSVLASGLRLWWVPLEGTTELETLVLCWHGNAKPREALRVQVSLHACRHAVGALETSSPATWGVTAGPETSSDTEYHMQKSFLKLYSPPITAYSYRGPDSHDVTATHAVVISPVKSSGIWHTSVCKCHVRVSNKCLLCFRFVAHLLSSCCAIWWGGRCESHFRCHKSLFHHIVSLDDCKRWRTS